MSMRAEEKLLRKLGLDFEVLDSGCCGMAGSFGLEKEHYDVSLVVGELKLLPAVRQAPKDTLIVAGGFSCQEQIAQTTGRRALHLAQVIQRALREGPDGTPGDYPEAKYHRPEPQPSAGLLPVVLLGAGAVLAGVALARAAKRRKPP
jgi:hypothetical protein